MGAKIYTMNTKCMKPMFHGSHKTIFKNFFRKTFGYCKAPTLNHKKVCNISFCRKQSSAMNPKCISTYNDLKFWDLKLRDSRSDSLIELEGGRGWGQTFISSKSIGHFKNSLNSLALIFFSNIQESHSLLSHSTYFCKEVGNLELNFLVKWLR